MTYKTYNFCYLSTQRKVNCKIYGFDIQNCEFVKPQET